VLTARLGEWVDGWTLTELAHVTAVSTRKSEVDYQLKRRPDLGLCIEHKQRSHGHYYRIVEVGNQLELPTTNVSEREPNMAFMYVLDKQGNPRVEPDVIKWGVWFSESQAQRRIAYDCVGDIVISTVFLGIDHALPNQLPILFETIVFKGELYDVPVAEARYHTKEEALKGHANIVRHVGNGATPLVFPEEN